MTLSNDLKEYTVLLFATFHVVVSLAFGAMAVFALIPERELAPVCPVEYTWVALYFGLCLATPAAVADLLKRRRDPGAKPIGSGTFVCAVLGAALTVLVLVFQRSACLVRNRAAYTRFGDWYNAAASISTFYVLEFFAVVVFAAMCRIAGVGSPWTAVPGSVPEEDKELRIYPVVEEQKQQQNKEEDHV